MGILFYPKHLQMGAQSDQTLFFFVLNFNKMFVRLAINSQLVFFV